MNYLPFYKYLKAISEKAPRKAAIKYHADVVTYIDLIQKVDQLAYELGVLGIRAGDVVAIHMRNSPEYIASILACAKIGVVYLPIPYTDPLDRIQKMFIKANPKAIICIDRTRENGLLSLSSELLFIQFSKTKIENIPLQNEYVYAPEDLLYIVFTSGSSGDPKGVMIQAESFDNYVTETIKCFGIDQNTISLLISPFHFDGSFGSIFCTLLVGGTGVILETENLLPRIFGRTLFNENITHVTCSPSYLQFIFLNLDLKRETNLKTVGIGGEDCSLTNVANFMQKLPNTRIINRYGPTETTVVVSSYEIKAADIYLKKKIPIGKPHEGVQFSIRDNEGKEVPNGVKGELYISGVQLMRGYCNDDIHTNNVLFNDLVSGEYVYRTGDVVSLEDDGFYYYWDRIDNMVNRYGNRIYPYEIELIVRNLDWVDEVCCLADKSKEPLTINLFVCPCRLITEREAQKIINQSLPSNMKPDRILLLEKMPINNNHKIDHKTLLSNLIGGSE